MRRKVTSQSSNITPKNVLISGISKILELPKVLPYPKFIPIDNIESVHHVFSYIIRHYGTDGLSVLIYRQPIKDQVVVICGDWNGNNIDMTNDSKLAHIANIFIQNSVAMFIITMKLIKLDQIQLFFAIVNDELILVDIQTAINKLSGPGMVRDIFGKTFKTQEVIKIEVLDDRAMEYIKNGAGNYAGDLILKPSRFRMFNNPITNDFSPLYIEVVR